MGRGDRSIGHGSHYRRDARPQETGTAAGSLATRRASAALVVVLALAGVGLAACNYLPGNDQGRTAGIAVDNRTRFELRFEVEVDGRMTRPPDKAPPHGTALVVGAGGIESGRCTTGPMVAFSTADGREMARHDEPLCVDDTWVIEESDLRPSAVPPESAPEADPT